MTHRNQEKLLRPADFVIYYFGGLRPAARAIGRSHAAINKWRHSKRKGGCDGFIPRIALHIILKKAKLHNWKIEAMDLMVGGRPIKRNGRV